MAELLYCMISRIRAVEGVQTKEKVIGSKVVVTRRLRNDAKVNQMAGSNFL